VDTQKPNGHIGAMDELPVPLSAGDERVVDDAVPRLARGRLSAAEFSSERMLRGESEPPRDGLRLLYRTTNGWINLGPGAASASW
jgi:hypothetical protein